MSESIRDLIVSIDFNDIDVRELIRVDSAIDEIEDQLRSMGHEIEDVGGEFSQMGIQAVLAATAAEAALEDVEDAADDAEDEVDGLSGAFGLAALKAGALGVAGAAAFSAIVAAGAPVLAVASGLASSAAAAGGAMFAYGAVATPILTELIEKNGELDELQKKVADAKTKKERIAAQKELAAAMKDTTKEQRFAMDELAIFKDFWSDFKAQFTPDVLNHFGLGLAILTRVLDGLGPTIEATSGVITELLEGLDQDIANGGMQTFFDWLATNGAEAIRNFATIGMNMFAGIFNIIAAFSPIGATVEENIVGLTERFKEWSQSFATSQGFQNFMAYVSENGPVLWEILGQVWQVLTDIVTAAAPIGTHVLNGFQWVLDKALELTPVLQDGADKFQSIVDTVQNNWPAVKETIIGITVAVGSFIAIMKGMQIIGVINTLMVAFRAGTLLATLAQMGLNLAMLANPITWVIAGIAALIAIGVLLYRNWDTVKAKAGELWDKTKEVFGKMGSWIVEKMQPVIDFFGRLKDKWDGFVGAIKNFKMPSFKMPSLFGGKGADGSHATGLSRVPFDGYRAILHKDEAVLTARQSDALRAAGILDTAGNKPKLGGGTDVVPTGKAKSGTTVFSPSITIEVNGASGDAREIGKQAAAAARKEMERLFVNLGFAFD